MRSNLLERIFQEHPFRILTVLLGIVMLVCYCFAGLMIYRHGKLTADFGWQSRSGNQGQIISSVDPSGPAAASLQVGDRVVAIDGVAMPGGLLPLKLRTIARQQYYQITVMRGGQMEQFVLSLPVRSDYHHYGHLFSFLIVSLSFFLIALIFGFYRPDQLITRLFALGAFGATLSRLALGLEPISPLFNQAELAGYYLIGAASPFYLALGYHFYYRFSDQIPRTRGWSALLRLLYLLGALLIAMSRSIDWLIWRDADQAVRLFADHYWLWQLRTQFYGLFVLIAISSVCAVVARNYRLISVPDQRRRIRWIVYGTTVGLLPAVLYWLFAVLSASIQASEIRRSNDLAILEFVANLALAILPITHAYAIIKHRLFDTNVVIRRGIQYLLAKNVLRLVLALPVLAILISNRNRTLAEILLHSSIYFYLLIFMLVALSLKFRARLTHWVDARFFRDSYNQEQILLTLADEIKRLDSLDDISRRMSERLEEALHPKGIFVFSRDIEDHDLRLGHSSGNVGDLLTTDRILASSKLFRTLAGVDQVLTAPFSIELPTEERVWLEQLGINLIVPMNGSDHHLIGLLLLGEKRSEQPYSETDCQLLAKIAGQLAVVCENTLLKEQVGKEQKIKQQVLARFAEQEINLVKECPRCGRCYDSTIDHCEIDQQELTYSLPVERIVEGKYRLDYLLGKGGMGAVYAATDLRLDRQIALKIMLGGTFGNQEALRRFEREARAAAKLTHPNIIAVFDYGRLAASGAYLVMELVPGQTMRSNLNRHGSLPTAIVADWFEQLLAGIAAAHQAGIIHRDLKPENVLITELPDGGSQLKILDFGLAKVKQLEVELSAHNLTAPGTVIGTLGYMPPEQLFGEDVDERGDIFSLGVMVVESLSGRRPYAGKTVAEVIATMAQESYHLTGESEQIRALDAVLQRCLAKDRQQRYSSIAELQDQLVPAIRNCSDLIVLESTGSAAATAKLPTGSANQQTRGGPAAESNADESPTRMVTRNTNEKESSSS